MRRHRVPFYPFPFPVSLVIPTITPTLPFPHCLLSCCLPMKRNPPVFANFLTRVLLVGLFLSSSTAVRTEKSAEQKTAGSETSSVRIGGEVSRTHALTVTPGQRLASDAAKQNRSRFSVSRFSVLHLGLTPSQSGWPRRPSSTSC